jgi:hypothetical protein
MFLTSSKGILTCGTAVLVPIGTSIVPDQAIAEKREPLARMLRVRAAIKGRKE